MDRLKQMQTYVLVATRGSLTAAATAEGVAPAMIGRRIDALEARLGIKLMIRTTRRISLTKEGEAFLEDCQRILLDVENAEAAVAAGGVRAAGHLRITAPAGFGRRHVAPLVPRFLASHPDVTLSLDLSDRVVDLVNEGYDCAIRIGDLVDSNLVSVRLAANRRVVVGSPRYLAHAGVPKTPDDLVHHNCLGFGAGNQQRGWLFCFGKSSRMVRVSGNVDCNDASVLTEWAHAGHGLAWRSLWEVGEHLASGALVEVLGEFAAPENGIYAVFAQRKHLPVRVRTWIDFLRFSYSAPDFWKSADNDASTRDDA